MPKFFVYAPDSTDVLDKRYEVRPQHLGRLMPFIDSGIIRVAGMITDPETPIVEGEQKKAIGSILIVEAENIEEVKKLLEEDIYIKTGVWDKEKLLIAPYFGATPFP
jgi:hypothetical protein